MSVEPCPKCGLTTGVADGVFNQHGRMDGNLEIRYCPMSGRVVEKQRLAARPLPGQIGLEETQ